MDQPTDQPTRNFTKTWHIIFDAIGCDKKEIADEAFVFNILIEIPKLIGMKILSGPNIVRDYNPDNLGITGVAIVSFSHITIHTFEKTGEIFIDIFSCKPFDYEKVKQYLSDKLKVSVNQVETQEIKYHWEK